MPSSLQPLAWLRRLNPFSSGSGKAFQPHDSSAPTSAALTPPPTQTEVVFLPRDPQWAYCFWTISDADRARARAVAASNLCLRVADVTGLMRADAQPHALQELVVDAQASEWFLPVPLAGRDYRVELGYRLPDGGWLSLAFSAFARIPELEPSLTIADAFVPFSLESPVVTAAAPVGVGAGGVQHERLYQMATAAAPRLRRVGSETLHEDSLSQAGALNDSGVGVWASGRSQSGSGLVRNRSFWLVADAELIVYGATEPTASLSIGEQPVRLDQDGGFRVQVPFADGQQTYAIRAVAADGEQQRSITLDFQRQTPEARVNSREQAELEWF